MDDEILPYRAHFPDIQLRPESRSPFTKDEENYDTLKAIEQAFSEALEELNSWRAFDLEEKEGMDIKQQIKAHQLAYEILVPLLEALRDARQTVDDKYKEK